MANDPLRNPRALMTLVVAGSNAQDLWNLVEFVGASYVAIAIMFAIHGILLVSPASTCVLISKRSGPC